MSIAVMGEALIDFIQGDDGAYRPHLGGSPYNVAIGLARQGVDVAYLSPLASDTFGKALADSLAVEGVRIPIARRSLWPTSLALVSVDAAGLPAYTLYREGIADKDSTFDELRAHIPNDTTLFHTGSLAITPSQLPKIRQLFSFLRAEGVLISVDINIRLGASIDSKAYLDGIVSLMDACDIVKASDEDLAALALDPDPTVAVEKLYDMTKNALVIVTEGRGGAHMLAPGGRVRKPAYRVTQVADTIGAGDTFHAAFLAQLDRSQLLDQRLGNSPTGSLERALDYACAAAAINVSRVGCVPPTHAEVEHFIRSTIRSPVGAGT